MLIERRYTLVRDDDNGYWMLLDDNVGIAKSKSRRSLMRIRDALEAVEGGGVYGLTVEKSNGKRGVVLDFNRLLLIVRTTTNHLEEWVASACHVVEPERPDKITPWNDPAIGVLPAVELLKQWLQDAHFGTGYPELKEATEQFLKAREDAQPVP